MDSRRPEPVNEQRLRERGERMVQREVVWLNVLSLAALFLSVFSQALSFFGGLVILLFISMKALGNPKRAFFIFFGVKFMLDAFWFIRLPIPGPGKMNLLVLSLLPLLLILLFSPRIRNPQVKPYIVLSFAYLAWVCLAMIGNGEPLDLELLTRQSGLTIGLLVGARFIQSEEDFALLTRMVFISTLLPVFMSLLQLMPLLQGLPFYHMKMDTVRSVRFSGLYYDPATTGMINIVSFLVNAYIMQKKSPRGRVFLLHVAMLASNFVVAIIGGTRSILIVMLIMSSILFLRKIRNIALLTPVMLAAFLLTQPYLDRMFKRTSQDVRRDVTLREVFEDSESRTMFTGRVSIWQDILAEFNAGSIFQKTLGQGKNSNAHSVWFFLLLQLGILGLLQFLLLNLMMLASLYRLKQAGLLKTIALIALLAFLVVGFSATTIVYTSFQWVVFMIVAGVMNIGHRGDLARGRELRA